MRECMWYREGDCWIDCPDSVYPCIAKGNLDYCPMVDLNGNPLKDSDYCVKKEEEPIVNNINDVEAIPVDKYYEDLLNKICQRRLEAFEKALDDICKAKVKEYEDKNG